jgi:hypothetical protein
MNGVIASQGVSDNRVIGGNFAGERIGRRLVEGISDIRITGIDETRRPRILKEPYINLYFKLSHKVPADLCSEFNRLLGKNQFPARINEGEGLYVETWVRDQGEIASHLELLKKSLKQCVTNHIDKINAANAIKTGNVEASAEQLRLNALIDKLNYE